MGKMFDRGVADITKRIQPDFHDIHGRKLHAGDVVRTNKKP